MTKTTAKKADDTIKAEDVKSAAATATTKVADGAREFVRRSAVTAKERTDEFYDNAEKFNSGLESALTRAATGYVSILGGMMKATHENVDRALTTVEKLAAAQSVSEAVRIQADYLRENTNANVDMVRQAANTTRDAVMENVSMVRDTAAKAWPYGKKAA